MITSRVILCLGLAALALGLCGCDTTDSGSSHTTVYYGVGFYDPWCYYSDYDHHDNDIVINPPPRDVRDCGRLIRLPTGLRAATVLVVAAVVDRLRHARCPRSHPCRDLRRGVAAGRTRRTFDRVLCSVI